MNDFRISLQVLCNLNFASKTVLLNYGKLVNLSNFSTDRIKFLTVHGFHKIQVHLPGPHHPDLRPDQPRCPPPILSRREGPENIGDASPQLPQLPAPRPTVHVSHGDQPSGVAKGNAFEFTGQFWSSPARWHAFEFDGQFWSSPARWHAFEFDGQFSPSASELTGLSRDHHQPHLGGRGDGPDQLHH